MYCVRSMGLIKVWFGNKRTLESTIRHQIANVANLQESERPRLGLGRCRMTFKNPDKEVIKGFWTLFIALALLILLLESMGCTPKRPNLYPIHNLGIKQFKCYQDKFPVFVNLKTPTLGHARVLAKSYFSEDDTVTCYEVNL